MDNRDLTWSEVWRERRPMEWDVLLTLFWALHEEHRKTSGHKNDRNGCSVCLWLKSAQQKIDGIIKASSEP